MVRIARDQTVFFLASLALQATLQDLEHVIFQVEWPLVQGSIVLHDHDPLTLPDGAFIRLSRHPRPEDTDDHCLLFQKQLHRSFQHESPTSATDFFRPYGNPQAALPAFLSSWKEGLAPRLPDHAILWGHFGTRPWPIFGAIESSFVADRYSESSPNISPTRGLRPPGNPEQCPGKPSDTFLNTLDVDYMNEGLENAVALHDERCTLVLHDLLRKVPTPCRAGAEKKVISLADSLAVEPTSNSKAATIPIFAMDSQDFDDLTTPSNDIEKTTSDPHIQSHELDLRVEDEIFEHILDFQPTHHALPQDCSILEEIHDMTSLWLQMHTTVDLASWDPHEFSWLEVFTDGSFDGSKSAWAFVVIAHHSEGASLVGFQAAAVQTEKTHRSYAGTLRHSAAQAELEALHWASWWCLKFAYTHLWPSFIKFRWDSTVAGLKACGKAKLGDVSIHGTVALRLRALQQGLETFLGPLAVAHEHVHAHCGQPLNELADIAAKTALRCQWTTDMFPCPTHIELVAPKAFEMLWLFLENHLCPAIPQLPVMNDGLLQWTTETQAHCDDQERAKILSTSFFPFRKVHSGNVVTYDFKINTATYNVLSLNDGAPSAKPLLGEPGRIALLREQAVAAKIHFLGIQEARTKQGVSTSSSHIRFSSGCTHQGHGGVELWVARGLPFAHTAAGQPVLFREQDFHVVEASPSCLCVTYDSWHISLLVVVAHAPHNGHSEAHRSKWWSDLEDQVVQCRASRQLVVLIDANARIGTEEDEAFSGLSYDLEDHNGQLLRAFAHGLQLCGPATFRNLHWGRTSTWQHPDGLHEARLDYILVPHSWMSCDLGSWVCENIHAGHLLPDHSCLCLQAQWQQDLQTQTRWKCPFDQKAILKSENQNTLAEILSRAPEIAWTINANEHAHSLVTWLHDELAKAFPPTPHNRAPTFANGDTQTLHRQLTSARRKIKALNDMAKDLWLREFFTLWRSASSLDGFENWEHCLRIELAKCQLDIKLFSPRLKQALLRDRQEYVQKVAQEANNLEVSEVYKKLRPILLPPKKGGPAKPLPRLKKIDGTTTQSADDLNARWVEHFAAIESGTVVDRAAFIAEALRAQRDRILPASWEIHDLPQLTWLEAAIQRSGTMKAPGPDLLANEVFRASPALSAKILLPLTWKLVLRLEEPIAWKGGRLVPLHKKRGPDNECQSYRGILLMGSLGKLLRASTRQIVQKPHSLVSDTMQMGGKEKMAVQFGSQCIRSYLYFTKQQGMSAAVIFADVQSAYYRALREFITAPITSDEDLARVVRSFNLDASVMHEIHAAVHGHHGAHECHQTGLQTSLLKEALSDTWFSCSGDETVATTRGTRPGDSWADTTYNVIMSKVLSRIKQHLREAGLLHAVPTPQELSPFNTQFLNELTDLTHVTWADDLALMVLSPCAALLPQRVADSMHILKTDFSSFAMDLSIGDQKTAALVCPRGKGAVTVRRSLFASPKANIPILFEEGCTFLPLVSTYRHLGGIVNSAATMKHELASRASKASAAFWKAARKVYKSRHLDLHHRKILFNSTVMSLWTWGSGSWPTLSAREFRTFSTKTWHFYGSIILRPHGAADQNMSHHEIQLILKTASPQNLLHEARLRHLGLMVRSAPQAVWAALLQDTKSIQAYQAAIAWMWQAIEGDCELEHFSNWTMWADLMKSSPARWKRLVKIAAARHLRYELIQADVQRWHRQLFTTLADFSLVDYVMPIMNEEAIEVCLLCSVWFKNRKGWFLHSNKCHGYVTPHGRAASGCHCLTCGKTYPSRLALLNHMRYSQRCCTQSLLAEALGNTPSLPPDEAHPQLPWRRVGQVVQEDVSAVDFEREALWAALCEWQQSALTQIAQPGDGDDVSLVQSLRDRLCCVLPYPKICSIFREWCALDSPCRLRPAMERLAAMVDQAAQWLYSFQTPGNGELLLPDMTTETSRKQIHVRHATPTPWDLLPVDLFYLHFFSGRRRDNDLQSALERLEVPPGHYLRVLSLDVQICERRCNLRQKDQQMTWFRLILAQRVVGCTAGPPCETWSVARQTILEGAARAPRPLRALLELWGLLAISHGESEQVQVGNELLCWALMSALAQALVGGFALVEHPQDAATYGAGRDNPSIWQLEAMRWLTDTGLFYKLSLCQGFFGAVSAKPTTLLIANVPSTVLETLARTQRATPLPTRGSIGKDGDQWRTAVLKEYPPSLCSLMASCFHFWLEGKKHLPPLDTTGHFDHLLDLCRGLDNCPRPTVIGPDYFRGAARPNL